MKEGLRRFAGWAFVEKWIDHQLYEAVFMRALFAVVIYDSINWGRTFSEIVAPNGLARIEPLQDLLLWFGQADHLALVRTWIWIPLAFYVLGILPIPTMLSVLAVTVCVGTLENSDGGIGHSYQIVSLILIAQLGSHLYTAVRANRADTWRKWLLPGLSMQNHAIT